MKNSIENTEINQINNEKRDYIAPALRVHGGLAELTQLMPGRGADGETIWTDCTLS